MNTNDYLMTCIADDFYKLGNSNRGREITAQLAADLLISARFYLEFYDYAQDNFETCGSYIYFLADVLDRNGEEELSKRLTDTFRQMMEFAAGVASDAASGAKQ
jgi:hypothetical protein